MATGGTAFPSGAPTVRSQAVQKVTGGKTPARYLNKASGKMETAAAMKAFRMPQQHSAPARAPQHMPSANKGGQNHAQTGQGSEQAQLHHLATKQIQQATHTELEPYKNKAAELTQYEGTAAKRLAGYAGKTDELLGGIQSGAQAAGKTFANQAAEAALKAQNSVNQDQTLTAQGNGNYLDPQVKAALENQRANIAGIGAARGSNAETLGQAESNFMTNIRAAAGQRALEGQGNVASRYGQQQTANSQAENSLIARQPERITGRESQLAKEAFTRKATEQGLGIKIGALRNTEAATKSKIRNEAGKLRLGEEKLGLERAKGQSDAEYKKADGEYKKLTAADKAAYDKAQIKYKQFQESNPGSSASVAEANKWAHEVAQVIGVANIGRNRSKAAYTAAREKLLKEHPGSGTEVINAGLNIAFYGHLVGNDVQNAFAHGLSPGLKPAWFKGK